MREEFQRALAAADDQRDASAKISVIKRAVSGEVRATDPTVSVKFTEYFNHSYAPDMILRWPRESRERLLFVRPTANAPWLLNDIDMVASHHPLVFTLEDLPTPTQKRLDAVETARVRLDETATATNTWITDPSGLAAISNVRATEPALGLLSQALVRGGRGVSDGDEVGVLARTTASGFSGASELSESRTRAAVQALESQLDAEQSGRLTRVMRALWEGHGGNSARFPATSAMGALTDDDLSYLLSATSQASPEFWQRIGRNLTTAQIGRLRVDDPSSSLQALLFANLETLQAKGVRVLYEPLGLGEDEDIPRWLIRRGCLALRGTDWIAYVAARLAEELPQPDEATPPTLNALRRRVSRRHVAITQVQFRTGDREVTYEAKDRIDVLDDPELRQVASDLNVTSIDSAVAVLTGGGNVNIDFTRKTAIGPTSSMFPLGALLRSTLPLLADFSPQEQEAIQEHLAETGQLSLFDDENN